MTVGSRDFGATLRPMPADSVRVVSLVPSVTETLEEWGLPPVGRTRFCPAGPGITIGGTKKPDIGSIVRCAPDLVVVEQEENRREDYEALLRAGLEVLALSIRDLGDVNAAMALLARRVGGHWSEVAVAPPPPPRDPSVRPDLASPMDGARHAHLRGFAAGLTWNRDHLLRPALPSTTPTRTDILNRGPDVVLAPSEPYPFSERHLHELAQFAAGAVRRRARSVLVGNPYERGEAKVVSGARGPRHLTTSAGLGA